MPLNTKEFIPLILDIFISYDSNLKFTDELENKYSLNFHDITLIRRNISISINWFQKSTSVYRLLNFNCNHSPQLKKNIVNDLKNRAILLSD